MLRTFFTLKIPTASAGFKPSVISVATPFYFKVVAEISLRRVTLALPTIMARYPAVPPGVDICRIGNGAFHAETYEVLEKVKAFFYAHSVTDADRENI
jgi:hypothetical protein